MILICFSIRAPVAHLLGTMWPRASYFHHVYHEEARLGCLHFYQIDMTWKSLPIKNLGSPGLPTHALCSLRKYCVGHKGNLGFSIRPQMKLMGLQKIPNELFGQFSVWPESQSMPFHRSADSKGGKVEMSISYGFPMHIGWDASHFHLNTKVSSDCINLWENTESNI